VGIIPFSGPTYQGRSLNVDSSRCVNFFPELTPDPNAKYPICLVGTAGTTLATTLGTNPIRAMYSFAGLMFVVSSNMLYAGASVTTLLPVGTLLTFSGYVSVSDNGIAANGLGGNQIILVDGVAGYIYDVSTNVFSQIESIAAVQATATLTVSTGTVKSITLNSQGSYLGNTPVTISITGGGGSGATASVIPGGSIAAIVVNFPVTVTGTPFVTISDVDGFGFGATATANVVSGSLTSITVNTGGQGYSPLPSSTIIAVTNAPGLVTAFGTNSYPPSIHRITINTPGSNYTSVPTVVFSGGITPFVPTSISGNGATVTVNFANHDLSSGDTILASGSLGATSGTYNASSVVTFISTSQFTYLGTGTGTPTTLPTISRVTLVNPPTATAVLSPVTITGITVINPGSGYIAPPIVTIAGAGALPFVPTAISGIGSVVTGTFAGHGMTTGDIITATGSSTPGYNTATPQIVTVISSSQFTYPGTGTGTPTTFPTVTDTTLGTITTSTTVVNSSITAITITSGGTGFIGVPAISISAPEGVSFPPHPTHVDYLDGYFIIVNGTLKFYVSELYNGLLWNALATAAVSASNDNTQTVVSSNQQLYFIGTRSMEVWSDVGVSTSVGCPFARVAGAVLPYGTLSGFSVVKGDGNFFFLGTQRTGTGSDFIGVMEMSGYTPQIVSTPSINYLISQMGDLSNVIAFTRIQEGHIFYNLHIPNGNSTLVYDSTTQMWHEWSSYSSTPYQVNRFIGHMYVDFNSVDYVGSYADGSIFAVDTNVYTENGNPIVSFRTSPHVTDQQSRKRVFYSNLLLDIEVGTASIAQNPQAVLSWSNDSGYTWSNEYPASLGQPGAYKTKVIWRRLGYTRDRVYRLMISDPIKKIVIGAYMSEDA
jgi:hypothetical protein